jgi:medium-chain acyl-[acyl-carrier-protein] hydrolase
LKYSAAIPQAFGEGPGAAALTALQLKFEAKAEGSSMADSVWFSGPTVGPSAGLRLFCLPYAGGGSSAYASWQAAVGPDVHVCPIVLPGREHRIAEPPASAMAALAGPLAEALSAHLDVPYALFGHSMGGLIAFEVARLLARHGLPAPAALLLSGTGPVRERDRPVTHHLPDPELLDALRAMNGTPPEFFDHPELVELLLPTIRADLTLAETFEVPESVRLRTPIVAFAGSGDTHAPPEIVDLWRRHTVAGFTMRVLPGEHFFLRDCPGFLEQMASELRRFRRQTV